MAVVRKFIDKNVLRNVIRHTDAHNKIQEESEMWRLRQLQTKAEDDSSSSRSFAGERKRKSSRYEDRMVADKFLCQTESSYWTKKLYEIEENDSDRWGHSGYREMYPEEFNSGSSEESSEYDKQDKKRKKKTKRSKQKKKQKNDKKEKSRHTKKSSKKRFNLDCITETMTSRNEAFRKEGERDILKHNKASRKGKVNGKTFKPNDRIKRDSKSLGKKKKKSVEQFGTNVKLKQHKNEEDDGDTAVYGCLLPPQKRFSHQTERHVTPSDDRSSRTKKFKSMQ